MQKRAHNRTVKENTRHTPKKSAVRVREHVQWAFMHISAINHECNRLKLVELHIEFIHVMPLVRSLHLNFQCALSPDASALISEIYSSIVFLFGHTHIHQNGSFHGMSMLNAKSGFNFRNSLSVLLVHAVDQ